MGDTNQQKNQMNQQRNEEYIDSIGFSADEMEMFDKAWEKLARKKSVEQPKVPDEHTSNNNK
jgi:hypothetical protein